MMERAASGAAADLVERSARRVDVAITVDVEFSIAGSFTDPGKFSPVSTANIFCDVRGKDHGLGLLLDTLREYSLVATFFVETANTHHFGDKPMGEVVDLLLRRGHDVQLHLHPCWRTFRSETWRQDVARKKPNDECARLSVAELEEALSHGIEKLQAWGAGRPVAFRTGNLSTGLSVYSAMARVGLLVASNLGLGLN